MVGSAKRGNRRVSFVISGLTTNNDRTIEAEKIVNWAYRDFTAKRIAEKHEEIDRIPVWLGEKKDVGLFPNEDIYVLISATEDTSIKALVSYQLPMKAPFKAGNKSPAKLRIVYNENSSNLSKEYDLFVVEGSNSGTFLTRMYSAIIILKNHIKRLIE